MIIYKGYYIEPRVLCFDIRYAVYGGDHNLMFFGEYFKDIPDAKKAIDKHIARKFINELLEATAIQLNVDKEIIVEVLSGIINENENIH